jgi:hypothetical protein
MSSIESQSSSSLSSPAPVGSHSAATRSPRARLISRSVIGLLLIVLAVEAIAYGRVTSAHRQLLSELQAGERQSHLVTKERIDAVVGREPDATIRVKAPVGEERFDVYNFGGLLKQRKLFVHYGVQGIKDEPEVIDVLMTAPGDVLAGQ